MADTNSSGKRKASTITWNSDPAHSTAEFKVKNMLISNVKGQFTKVSGTLLMMNPIMAILVSNLPRRGVYSHCDAQRDAHLKSADSFADCRGSFRHWTFRYTAVRVVRDRELSVERRSQNYGVTVKSLAKVGGSHAFGKDHWGNTRIGFWQSKKINRKDVGLKMEAAREYWRDSRGRRCPPLLRLSS